MLLAWMHNIDDALTFSYLDAWFVNYELLIKVDSHLMLNQC
jgi:hypothetical protein